jgi:hypothetical protein
MMSNPPVASIAISVCAMAGSLFAQGPFSGLLPKTTFPSDHKPDLANKKLVNGRSSNWWFPFSYGKARQMVLYEKHDLKIPHAAKISHLGFQAEKGRQSKGHKVLMKVYMGRSNEAAKSMKATFASNWFGAPSQVFGGTSGKVIALPDLGNSLSPNPNTPFVWLPLDTPYTYDNTRNLAVDYQALANDNSNKFWYYYTDAALLESPVVKNGDGCKDGSGQIPVLKSRPTSIDSRWYVDLSNAPNSTPTVMLASLGKATIPYIRTDCFIRIDVTAPNFIPFFFIGNTNTAGRYGWSTQVPNDPAFNDVHLYSQAFVKDVFATAGFALSNGDDMQIGMNPQMSVLYRLGDPTTVTTGSVLRNFGVISHFRH